MIVTKKKNSKFDQKTYDYIFYNIENNLRELGFGDVSVNKKMKEFNKILYDILLKLDLKNLNNKDFKINTDIVKNYFTELESVFAVISECENGKNINALLEGPVCHSGFKRLN